MRSVATRRFWSCFAALPDDVQRQAERAPRLWHADPSHRSLDFKHVRAARAIVLVRIGRRWPALGVRDGDTIAWFWTGSHADYDQQLGRL